MKKFLKCIVILVFILFVCASCSSPPPPKQSSTPNVKEAENESTPIEQKEEPKAPVAKNHEKEKIKVYVTEYTVKWGDTLSQIALKFYKTKDKAYYFPIIMVMNPGRIKHPDKLLPGSKLLVPDFTLFMQSSELKEKAKPEFKKCIKLYTKEGKHGVVQFLNERIKKL